MALYVVLKMNWQEEDFGRITADQSSFCGVYSSKEMAQKAIKSFGEPELFHATNGYTETTSYHIIEAALDEVVSNYDWNK